MKRNASTSHDATGTRLKSQPNHLEGKRATGSCVKTGWHGNESHERMKRKKFKEEGHMQKRNKLCDKIVGNVKISVGHVKN